MIRRPAANGFTLIETIVVLVILGLALSIVATFLPRRNGTLMVSSAAARIGGALRLARSRAMTESRPVLFAVLPDGHGYRMDDAPVTIDPSITLAIAPPRPIRFAPDGSASGGVLVIASDGRQAKLQVDWLTGRVTAGAAR